MWKLASLALPAVASLVLVSAAHAAPKEVYLGDVVSPRRALDGKTFRLKAGQRLRFTHLQTTWGPGRAIHYFYSLKATPKGALYHGARVMGTPAGAPAGSHYRQETFSVLRAAPVGTVITVKGSCPHSRDWNLSFKIVVTE